MNGNDDAYKKALCEFNEMNEKCHVNYISMIQKNIKEDPSFFWKFASERSNNSKYPSVMYYDNNTADEETDIVNLFAKNFQTYFRENDTKTHIDSILSDCASDSKEI